MQADEAVGMTMTRIVVRPVDDRRAARIVHDLAANLDTVADLYRTPWRERDVVDYLQRPSRRIDVECFVYAAGARAEEESRRRSNGGLEVDECRRRAGVRCEQINSESQSHADTAPLARRA